MSLTTPLDSVKTRCAAITKSSNHISTVATSNAAFAFLPIFAVFSVLRFNRLHVVLDVKENSASMSASFPLRHLCHRRQKTLRFHFRCCFDYISNRVVIDDSILAVSTIFRLADFQSVCRSGFAKFVSVACFSSNTFSTRAISAQILNRAVEFLRNFIASSRKAVASNDCIFCSVTLRFSRSSIFATAQSRVRQLHLCLYELSQCLQKDRVACLLIAPIP